MRPKPETILSIIEYPEDVEFCFPVAYEVLVLTGEKGNLEEILRFESGEKLDEFLGGL